MRATVRVWVLCKILSGLGLGLALGEPWTGLRLGFSPPLFCFLLFSFLHCVSFIYYSEKHNRGLGDKTELKHNTKRKTLMIQILRSKKEDFLLFQRSKTFLLYQSLCRFQNCRYDCLYLGKGSCKTLGGSLMK